MQALLLPMQRGAGFCRAVFFGLRMFFGVYRGCGWLWRAIRRATEQQMQQSRATQMFPSLPQGPLRRHRSSCPAGSFIYVPPFELRKH